MVFQYKKYTMLKHFVLFLCITLLISACVQPDIKAELSRISENFSKLSDDAQEFILNTEWIKDGVDEDDIRYIDSIPVSFNPADKSADTDKGGLEDVWEVMYKGEVDDSSDDIPLLLNYSYYIPR